jgi:GDPmannose 4,6-dehydratase
MKNIKKKIALITGVTGQDGSLLADFLLKKNYKVIGVKRRSSTFNTSRIEHLYKDFQQLKDFIPYYGDMTDSTNLIRIIKKTQPDEIYNLAAQSHVHTSFETPEYTANADAVGALRILEAIRLLNLTKKVKFYQASTSEMFGNSDKIQNEKTPFNPVSPYGISKLFAYWMTVSYRNSYKMFACNGILFNHEGPRRGETFVTRKISRAVAEIYKKKRKILYLGNLDAKRDWGYANDYVESMWLMLQKKKPDDYVIATGITKSVRQFVVEAFKQVNINILWKGKKEKEIGYDRKTKKELIKIDPRYYRPTEVNILKGDYRKAKKMLGWKPKKKFQDIVKEMVLADLKILEK